MPLRDPTLIIPRRSSISIILPGRRGRPIRAIHAHLLPTLRGATGGGFARAGGVFGAAGFSGGGGGGGEEGGDPGGVDEVDCPGEEGEEEEVEEYTGFWG